MTRLLLLGFVVASVGCSSPQPAPKDLDGLARFFFDRFAPKNDDGTDADPAVSDAELQDAVVKINDSIDGDHISGSTKGTLGNLTIDELDTVGLSKSDPKKPQGVFITNIIKCDLDTWEKIVLNPDQLSLYPEAYATYDRTQDADRPGYNPTWVVTYKSSSNALITNQFTATEHSGIRKVPDVPDSAGNKAAFGRFDVARVFMPKPAVFDNPDPGVVDYSDDYQIEALWPRGDGELVHFYGMWRYMHLGALGDSYSGLFIDQTTGGMIDWDTKTEALCAAQ